MARLKPCSRAGCGELVKMGNRYCAVHKAEFDKQSAGWSDRPSKRFMHRTPPGYRARRQKVMRRDNGLCQVCLAEGIHQSGTEVDHIVPIAFGGTDSMSNLQTICVPHHREKTKIESMRGSKAVK